VLNPYLEVMSSVLHRHEALINKFMGDGIFAFFNPPILPCPQHVLAACEAALDSQRALRELVARFDDHPLAEEFRRLFTRIGIASGPVFVGDYGSENKLDYTCMGDTVNLAARLEAANKQFSTATMLSGTCRDAVGDRYVYRHLGAVQVKGQTAVVHIYELLGRTGEVDDEQMRFAEVYGEAVVRFARRDWEGAARGFGRCLELRPADRGAPRHLDAIREYASDPPPDGWAGGIELTEK
jgi:adenylate cyclase